MKARSFSRSPFVFYRFNHLEDGGAVAGLGQVDVECPGNHHYV
jgi:hypothetical protein